MTGYALLTLCRKSGIFDSVGEKIGISFNDLVTKSVQADPILSTEKFMNLLNRMSPDDGLGEFIDISTEYLFITGHTDLIYSRLDALENGKILHASARAYQIQVAFLFGARYQDQSWIESFYDNPMILPNVYAKALIDAGRKGINNKLFKRLLEEADEEDLKVTQGNENMHINRKNFVMPSKEPSPQPSLDGMRVFPHERVMVAKKVFEDNPSLGIFKEITRYHCFLYCLLSTTLLWRKGECCQEGY